MTIRLKVLAAAAVPVTAAGVAVAVGGSAHAATQTAPTPIGYTVAATNAHSDSISGITATFGTTTVGSTAVQVPTADPVQFGASDSLGAAVSWSFAGTMPTGFALTGAGALTLPAAPVTAPVTFTVKAADSSAVAFATVTVGAGAATVPAEDSVSVTPDTVVLNAPVNAHGQVYFQTVPGGVAETLANGPAGAVFRYDVLSAGRAVPGDYANVAVTATDAAGATAVETFDAVVRPVYAPIPRLSQGHAVFVGTSRENVYFYQSGAASWDHFTIVGPGAIDGHQGWVNGQLGLNVAVYGGLEYNHGYTVYYQPVEGQGSTTPVPGSHWGYVFFVS